MKLKTILLTTITTVNIETEFKNNMTLYQYILDNHHIM